MAILLAALAVAVSGTAQQGQKLTATVDAGTTVQWYRCAPDVSHCTSIHGATAVTYTLGAKDVGKVVALDAKASDGTMSYPASVGPVAAKAGKLVATAAPKITGDAIVGKTLSVDDGAWTGKPTGYTYAWLRCNPNGRICVAIAAATAATYVPTADDVGHELVARVTASSGAVAQPSLSIASTAVVAASGPVATVQPSVSGTAQQGQKLSLADGTWTGTGAVKLTDQWYRCDAQVSHCSSVHGATGLGYTLGAKDVGHTLAVTVKAVDSVATVSVYVSAVGPVVATAATAVATAQPKVTGTTTLSVDNGTWKTAPTTFAYQWLRCNANGRICVPIAGATQQTYVQTAADTGHSLVATVNGALSTRT